MPQSTFWAHIIFEKFSFPKKFRLFFGKNRIFAYFLRKKHTLDVFSEFSWQNHPFPLIGEPDTSFRATKIYIWDILARFSSLNIGFLIFRQIFTVNFGVWEKMKKVENFSRIDICYKMIFSAKTHQHLLFSSDNESWQSNIEFKKNGKMHQFFAVFFVKKLQNLDGLFRFRPEFTARDWFSARVILWGFRLRFIV